MLLRKILFTGAIVSFTMAGIDLAQAETVQDHYKTIIDQTPYSVEVCNNVTTGGDKTADALTGAIIGGIIGNNIKGEEDGSIYVSSNHARIGCIRCSNWYGFVGR